MLFPEIAEKFQSMSYNALINDPRSIGGSDGRLRNQIDPLQQAEDLSGKSDGPLIVSGVRMPDDR